MIKVKGEIRLRANFEVELDMTEDERELYTNIRFVEPQNLNYFHWMSQCIKLSSRYEILCFLGVKNEQIGFKSSDYVRTAIKLIVQPR
jgi:hypothetical protein